MRRRQQRIEQSYQPRQLEENMEGLAILMKTRPQNLYYLYQLLDVSFDPLIEKYLQYETTQLYEQMKQALQLGVDPLDARHRIERQIIEGWLIQSQQLKAIQEQQTGSPEAHIDFIDDDRVHQKYREFYKFHAMNPGVLHHEISNLPPSQRYQAIQKMKDYLTTDKLIEMEKNEPIVAQRNIEEQLRNVADPEKSEAHDNTRSQEFQRLGQMHDIVADLQKDDPVEEQKSQQVLHVDDIIQQIIDKISDKQPLEEEEKKAQSQKDPSIGKISEDEQQMAVEVDKKPKEEEKEEKESKKTDLFDDPEQKKNLSPEELKQVDKINEQIKQTNESLEGVQKKINQFNEYHTVPAADVIKKFKENVNSQHQRRSEMNIRIDVDPSGYPIYMIQYGKNTIYQLPASDENYSQIINQLIQLRNNLDEEKKKEERQQWQDKIDHLAEQGDIARKIRDQNGEQLEKQNNSLEMAIKEQQSKLDQLFQ